MLATMPSIAEVTKSWMLSMSVVTAADQIAGALLVVLGQGQATDVVIHRAPQLVHDPLSDVGGEVALQVGAGGADGRDGGHRRPMRN